MKNVVSLKSLLRPAWEVVYHFAVLMLMPLNFIGIKYYTKKFFPNSVLHISYMVHVPYYLTRTLRQYGIKADYMAIGTSPVWNRSDYQIEFSRWPFVRVIQEFIIFWKIMSRYEIIHSHFMVTLTYSAWEWPVLKKMGRKIIIHYRGCEIRDREKILKTYSDINICQECDYAKPPCRNRIILIKRALAARHGDLFLVTTPDLKMFAPQAAYIPFFTPEFDNEVYARNQPVGRIKDGFKIIHATNQPGIEGTKHIQKAVDNLIQKGHKIELVILRNVPHEMVLKELASADLSVGKLKMGYYANAQIEGMLMGVPTITYIRPEFMTEELVNSGFIFSSLANLEGTIEYYLNHPNELQNKCAIARTSILRIHDNQKLAKQLSIMYRKVLN
jgi:hypothetical protein